MIDMVDAWHREHARFGRMLGLFEAQLAEFHDEGTPDYEVMRDVVRYLRDYADRYHHPREDLAFAALLRREPQLLPVINRLLQEHRVISHTSSSLLGLLDQMLSDAMIPRATVEATAAMYLAYYRNHLNTEERDILPRAAAALTADDWREVDTALPAGPDPFLDVQIRERYRSLSSLLE